jgi:hypothetical protein
VIKKYGDWYAESTELILRKAHVAGLLSNDNITKSDYESFNQLIKDLGCEPFKRA